MKMRYNILMKIIYENCISIYKNRIKIFVYSCKIAISGLSSVCDESLDIYRMIH